MTMIMKKIQRLLRSRQLHTIISQETIKPSSPTPPHLKTHNLSQLDHFAPNFHVSFILFYKNYNNNVTNILKKSLSQSLEKYYPVAGRFTSPSASYIDCNDAGVEFLEAANSSRLEDYILKKEQDEMFDQLIPHALGCAANITSPNMAEVQLNHFTCGGAAIAVSISHKIADGFTIASFLDHWATVACGGSPANPSFIISSPKRFPEVAFNNTEDKVKFVTNRFVFLDSRLNELKNKINEMGTSPVNPTRVEALTSLLFRCAVSAATTKSGYFQPSKLIQALNARKCITNFPNLVAGNLTIVVSLKMVDSGQLELNEVITKLRKEITEFRGLRNVEHVEERFGSMLLTFGDDQSLDYRFSSMCKFPFYETDFGWGKPVRVMLRSGVVGGNFFILMDTPSGDGIEAQVQLEEEEMDIFQKDKELLQYVEDM